MDIAGKTFIVTGGSSGLGKGTCEVFTAAGANVVVADLKPDEGHATVEALGKQAVFSLCDVTNEDQVRAAIAIARDRFGGLHGAINCAGVGVAMKTVAKNGAHPLDLFNFCLNVNVTGTFNVIRLCAESMMNDAAMENGERGVFVNTASVAAYDGQIGQPAYSASKGAVVAMTLPIAREFARFGLRVVTIAPGLFDTPMLASLPEEAKASLAAQVPFPSRLGRPQEFGQLAKSIVENEMLNGETIRLDGAIRMAPK
ncbi:MAG: SDR family NAD(P)-dependent oxidoreductase [Candidatus Hydrogenedens sp.]|nr:SDR family NAD(P)-dependent oxidoreductase [Candidatus Hydrogenedens sp.]